eukprot:758984-Hanusia_phi.AAC.1
MEDSHQERIPEQQDRIRESSSHAKSEGQEEDEGGLFCAVEPYLNLSPKSKQVDLIRSCIVSDTISEKARARLNTEKRKLTHARPSMGSQVP